MDVVQEHRAEQAAAALRDSVAVRATARRDGRAQAVPVESLVAGDVVELTAGGAGAGRWRDPRQPGRRR